MPFLIPDIFGQGERKSFGAGTLQGERWDCRRKSKNQPILLGMASPIIVHGPCLTGEEEKQDHDRTKTPESASGEKRYHHVRIPHAPVVDPVRLSACVP